MLSQVFAQATTQSTFRITPPIFWLIVGVLLCLVEFLIPKSWAKRFRFIALMMGVGALLVSFIVWQGAIALGFEWQFLMYDGFSLQVMYWMGLSFAFAIWLRPILIRRPKYTIPEATQAQVLTEILPGETGRVMYEGSSWQACCADPELAIAPNQTVYVVRREDNTLIVMP